MKVFVLIFVILGISFSSQGVKTDLQLVHVFLRHGSRTPEAHHTYPNDPYKEQDFQPPSYGQLTNAGKQRAYKLGKLLRKRYDSFLGDIYTPNSVQAISTDYTRTKMSALLALAGLYQPAPTQQWDDDLLWQPIPYDYDKDKFDFTLRRPTKYCPQYVKELEEVQASSEIQQILKENSELFKYLEQHTGHSFKTLDDIFGLYQTLYAETQLNMTLPDWTKSVFPEKITELAVKQCELENSNDILKKLNGGRMLGKIIENMVAKSTENLEPKERKIFLYSGHENNVINILAALNLYKPHFPKYSAAVLVELHYVPQTESYGVKIYYARDVDETPEELQLDGCDKLCSLHDFVKIAEPHIPVNYTAECESSVNFD